MSRRVARYGPWAVVTGASSGIGRAIATRLAAEGFDLVLVARSGRALQELATALQQAHRISARVVAADLASTAGLDAVLAAVEELEVGLFVANAGFGTSGAFVEAELAAEEAMLDTNCRALLRHTHYFALRMQARGRGGIILLSSMLARQGTPWVAHYAATKAYVTAFGEALRVELAPSGVQVLVAEPGPTDTGFGARAGMSMGAMMTADAVAGATLDALGRTGRVLPGGLSKLLVWSMAMLPRVVRVQLMGTIMRGMARRAAS